MVRPAASGGRGAHRNRSGGRQPSAKGELEADARYPDPDEACPHGNGDLPLAALG